MDKGFNYGLMMQRALRGLMEEVLSHVAEYGLPGRHHFFITFDTQHPGVDMPEWLHRRHPREMTIVLQEWFEDLAVAGGRFSVTLNFGDAPERIVVPFDAIRTFVDPSVEFGLRFDAVEGPEDPDTPPEPEPPSEPEESAAEVVRLDRFRRT
ncbi:MAG TPA: ClpXP protease specificity-enhancing factor SspB [Paracoccaceae bacterium]|nr:ClpXP protease specificity-enhancing factor SspB [Paracoccaceae bacterium]